MVKSNEVNQSSTADAEQCEVVQCDAEENQLTLSVSVSVSVSVIATDALRRNMELALTWTLGRNQNLTQRKEKRKKINKLEQKRKEEVRVGGRGR